HGVLDLLRLDETEYLGAEVLRPVGPADAAARHLAEAQVHAFDARRIDEDLEQWARQRHQLELAARELDGDQGFRLPVAIELVEAGAHRHLHRAPEMAQDAGPLEGPGRRPRPPHVSRHPRPPRLAGP